jgi:hypothetical protein
LDKGIEVLHSLPPDTKDAKKEVKAENMAGDIMMSMTDLECLNRSEEASSDRCNIALQLGIVLMFKPSNRT